MELSIRGSSFNSGENIPVEYTGEGQDKSPPLEWMGVPKVAKELALLVEDPDAPQPEPWVHWLLFKIPASVSKLPEGIPAQESLQLPRGALQGINSFGRIGYGGPLPPPDHGPHRYFFKLYALDTELSLKPGATKREFLDAIESHVLAQAEMIGRYERPARRKAG